MKVFEIFKSISGEVAGCPQGSLATFIRFSGCNLKCKFCDAEETQSGKIGSNLSVKEIINKVNEFGLKNVILTGGEPLIQDRNAFFELITELKFYSKNYNVSIETNGTILPATYIHKNCTVIMDYKLDQIDQMIPVNFIGLKRTDFIKFVIEDEKQLKIAIQTQKNLIQKKVIAQFAYSPMMPKMTDIMKDPNNIIKTQKLAKTITNELIKNQLEGIINIQMHKILNLV